MSIETMQAVLPRVINQIRTQTLNGIFQFLGDGSGREARSVFNGLNQADGARLLFSFSGCQNEAREVGKLQTELRQLLREVGSGAEVKIHPKDSSIGWVKERAAAIAKGFEESEVEPDQAA